MAVRTSPAPSGGKMNLFGTRLQSMRCAKGWTQEQLAARLQKQGWDIDMATLARIEVGRRTLTDFELAFFLRILGAKWSTLDASEAR